MMEIKNGEKTINDRHAGGDPGKSGEYYRKIFITKRGQMLHGIRPLRQYSYLLSGTPRSSARKRSGTSSSRIFLTTPGSFAVSPTG